MARAGSRELVDAVVGAVSQSGGVAHLLSAANRNPRRFLVQLQNAEFALWAYLWTLTHGGRKSLPDEFRIQMTGVESPLEANPAGPTVLMGYEPDRAMFAGFDVERHREFTAGSPSVQVDVTSLDDAAASGLSFHEKSNQEIAVGIRPDHLVTYALRARDLHRDGADAQVRELLTAAANREPIPEESVRALGEERKRVVLETAQWARANDFRARVLTAYSNTCAVSRFQLGILDAAHILPVRVEGSTDETSNGICLAPSFHRAFDAGLIYLDEGYTLRIEEGRAAALANEGLGSGLDQLRSLCDRRVLLPSAEADRPNPTMIRLANQLRGVD